MSETPADLPDSTEQLKTQHSSLLEKMTGGVLTKEIEDEMKKIITAHVADFTA
jgi:F-type H+-transporting ATPase subunit alpha